MQITHPLLNKIQELQESERTGILPLEKENHNIIICFQHGQIAAAGGSVSQLQLGRVLSRRGVLQNAALPKLLEMARRRRFLLGKAAVSRNLLDEVDLKAAVRDQVIQAIAHALAWDFEIRPFRDGEVDLYTPANLNCDMLLLELARNDLKTFRLDPGRMISLNNGHSLSHLPWYPHELSVLGQLKTPRTVEDLSTATGMDYERLNKILSVLDSLQLINRLDTPAAESTAVIKYDRFPLMNLTPEIGESGLIDKLEVFHHPSSFISEQFRTLKVRITEMAAHAPLNVIAVSSSQPEDGKSLISANLAFSLAKDPGRKVILVDCDLRNPSLQKFLGISAEPGLIGYLENKDLQPYCYMRRLGSLFFMTSGGASENSIELLSNNRMGELIAYLKTEFDTIILDCPPFGPISDAQIMTAMADGLLMVVRCGKTTYATMEKAVRNFDRNKLIGLVFNDVKPMMFNTQYHYKYYHYRNRGHYPYGIVKPSSRPKNYLD